jgi:hypothetical protein
MASGSEVGGDAIAVKDARGRWTTGLSPSNDNASFDSFPPRAMRALLTFGSLLIVLGVIALTLRAQLQAGKRFLPSASAASDASSAPFGGGNSPTVSQYQRELDRAMKASARRTDEQAASAGEDGTR